MPDDPAVQVVPIGTPELKDEDAIDLEKDVVARMAALAVASANADRADNDDVQPSTATSEDLEDDIWSCITPKNHRFWTTGKGPVVRPPVLKSFDLQGVVDYIHEKQVRNVICMCGAGISVSAGIPDFRTPGTGLYDNLQKYDLPHPTAVFELGFFRTNPQPFFMLAKELAPGNFQPTTTHHFVKLLHDKGILRRCYTQNIDSLEAKAGLPADKVVAAHGNFDGAHCIDCSAPFPLKRMRVAITNAEVCYCKACGGLAKPSIVFFGENLPPRFFELQEEDFAACDLLIVMGTSLVVHPFAGLLDLVGADCPRLLLNREVAGEMHEDLWKMGCTRGMWFGEGAWRDVKHLGDCDSSVLRLAELLGWRNDLDALLSRTAAAAD